MKPFIALLLTGCQGSAGQVVINEVLAQNATGLTDEGGMHPDWLEVHNTGDEIDLTGFTLTDDPELETPWPFPDGTIVPAGGYLVVFCDNDPEEGPLHANFRLDGAGETLQLADPDGAILDEVVYPEQPVDDVSWGRVPDAGAEWVALDPPTPGAAN